ncbi:MAG: DUF4492 domain-containing protein [Bacteroidia bacterium]|nr:MAG: DUF4492 domain-containing protein [Bacteroidia bacterium]
MAREGTVEQNGGRRGALVRVFSFYYEGFRGMTVGRTLWLLILLKLAIMFLVLKVFFFPNFLNTNFSTDAERSDHVLKELTKQNK